MSNEFPESSTNEMDSNETLANRIEAGDNDEFDPNGEERYFHNGKVVSVKDGDDAKEWVTLLRGDTDPKSPDNNGQTGKPEVTPDPEDDELEVMKRIDNINNYWKQNNVPMSPQEAGESTNDYYKRLQLETKAQFHQDRLTEEDKKAIEQRITPQSQEYQQDQGIADSLQKLDQGGQSNPLEEVQRNLSNQQSEEQRKFAQAVEDAKKTSVQTKETSRLIKAADGKYYPADQVTFEWDNQEYTPLQGAVSVENPQLPTEQNTTETQPLDPESLQRQSQLAQFRDQTNLQYGESIPQTEPSRTEAPALDPESLQRQNALSQFRDQTNLQYGESIPQTDPNRTEEPALDPESLQRQSQLAQFRDQTNLQYGESIPQTEPSGTSDVIKIDPSDILLGSEQETLNQGEAPALEPQIIDGFFVEEQPSTFPQLPSGLEGQPSKDILNNDKPEEVIFAGEPSTDPVAELRSEYITNNGAEPVLAEENDSQEPTEEQNELKNQIEQQQEQIESLIQQNESLQQQLTELTATLQALTEQLTESAIVIQSLRDQISAQGQPAAGTPAAGAPVAGAPVEVTGTATNNAELMQRLNQLEEQNRELRGQNTPEQKSLALQNKLDEIIGDRQLSQLSDAERLQYYDILNQKQEIDRQIGVAKQETERKRNRKEKWIRRGAFVVGGGVALLSPPATLAAVLAVTLGGRFATPLIQKGAQKLRNKAEGLKYENRNNKTMEQLNELDRKIKRNEWWGNRLGEVASVVSGGTAGYGLGKMVQNIFGWKGIQLGNNAPEAPQGPIQKPPQGPAQQPPQGPMQQPPVVNQPPIGGGAEAFDPSTLGDSFDTSRYGWDWKSYGWKGSNLSLNQGITEGGWQRTLVSELFENGVTDQMLNSPEAGRIFANTLGDIYRGGNASALGEQAAQQIIQLATK